MKRVFTILFLSLFIGLPAFVNAEEVETKVEEIGEVVVTATRLKTPTGEVGSSITVITGKEIEEKQKTTVLEVLRSVPGLDVVQQGGPGGTTSIFVRGAKSEHTLVLIDGVEMNDPITPGRSYNSFADLTVDNIERIEILRGPQSTLYGSDAIGGVINIITKKGQGKPAFSISGEAGSFDTFHESAGVSGGNDLVSYSFAISRLDTDGISAANEKEGNGEEDGYDNTTVSGRFGLIPTEKLNVDLTLRYIDARTDIDNSGGVGGDDPNNVSDSKKLLLRTEAQLFLFNDMWEQKMGFSLTDHDRDSRNDIDSDHPSDLSRSSYDSQILRFDWQHNLYINETYTLTFGLETEEEKGRSNYYSESAFGPFTSTFEEKTARTTGYYLQDQTKLWDRLFITLGVRLDDHNKFGKEDTYRIASTYMLKETGTRIKGTYGTGFKAPSLFQLFDASNGNKDLDPETSKGWDVGIEQRLMEDKVRFGGTYFHNNINNLIVWTLTDPIFFTGEYKNVDEIESKGVELFASIRPIDDLTFTADYTYTDTENKTTRNELARRPKNKGAISIGWIPGKTNFSLTANYVGDRWDDAANTKKLDAYTKIDFATSYDFTEKLNIFGRIENLTDEEYEEVKGYGTPGSSIFGGLKFTF
ncbi:MAG: TonB-dependent receptor plug domain-containing protein [Thermodesulfobacteriota bacterium]